MENKIKRFQRLATLRKRDISKEITNSNLLQNEINKNKNLIDQINTIMDSSKDDASKKEKDEWLTSNEEEPNYEAALSVLK